MRAYAVSAEPNKEEMIRPGQNLQLSDELVAGSSIARL